MSLTYKRFCIFYVFSRAHEEMCTLDVNFAASLGQICATRPFEGLQITRPGGDPVFCEDVAVFYEGFWI